MGLLRARACALWLAATWASGAAAAAAGRRQRQQPTTLTLPPTASIAGPGAAAALAALPPGANATLAADSAGSLPAVTREEVCQVCFRSCAINCYAGTCGLNYPLGVSRYLDSSYCYACDEVTGASVRGAADFEICNREEAAAPPPILQSASFSEPTQEAMMRNVAAQIRQAQALKASEAAHVAWMTASEQYNMMLEKLRTAELEADQAKEALDGASDMATAARQEYQAATAEARAAMLRLATQSAQQSGAVTEEAQQQEARAQAASAYRRLLIAQGAAAKAYRAAAAAAAAAAPPLPPKPDPCSPRGPAAGTSTLPPCAAVQAVGTRRSAGLLLSAREPASVAFGVGQPLEQQPAAPQPWQPPEAPQLEGPPAPLGLPAEVPAAALSTGFAEAPELLLPAPALLPVALLQTRGHGAGPRRVAGHRPRRW